MRNLRIFEHISLDGVMQHSADENGFAYANWTGPYRTPAGLEKLLALYGERYDLLLGRRTYDSFSNYWPKAPSSPAADRLNAAKKYVVTHNPAGLEWGPFEAIGTDLVEEVNRLKSQDGPDILVMGSSTLTTPLLQHGLADELVVSVFPVFLGTGKRLFAEGTPAQAFELISTDTTPAGVILNVYKPAGALKTS